jgi:hypothetical protein
MSFAFQVPEGSEPFWMGSGFAGVMRRLEK